MSAEKELEHRVEIADAKLGVARTLAGSLVFLPDWLST